MFDPVHEYARSEVIGRVVATADRPATASEFYFWARNDNVALEVGSIVVAVSREGITFGVLDEPQRYTDTESFMEDYIAHDFGDVSVGAPTAPPEILVFKAKVLRTLVYDPQTRTWTERMRPAAPGDVRFPTEVGIQFAMYADRIEAERRIPAGLFRNSDGSLTPICIDEEFLLGMEGAHLNVTGVSGLATKTSYVEFLLASLFAHSRRSIAVVCFNVKGPDLLFLDQPNYPEDPADQERYRERGVRMMSDEQRHVYQALGVPPRPFENVHIFAPYKSDGATLNTTRTHPHVRNRVRPFVWGLKDIIGDVRSILDRDDLDEKAEAFLAYVRDRWITPGEVLSFDELDSKLKEIIEEAEGNDQSTYQSHHIATIRKIRNRLVNIPARCPGLVARGRVGESDDIPLKALQNRDVYVIDVSGLGTTAQELVFHKVIGRLGTLKERGELQVDHVIVFVDELNKFAPRLGETRLKRTLIEISARGRYIGFVLFGAQQFRSKVDDEVVGNTATSVYGRMDAEEIVAPPYRMFTDTVKDKLLALDKGELLLRHPHFKQPVFVRFPVPPVLRGKEGLELWPPQRAENAQRVYDELKKLDPSAALDPEEIRRAVDGLDEETVTRILEKTRQRYDPRRSTFVWTIFRTALRIETGHGP